MSRWSVYSCENVSTGPRRVVVERFEGAFASKDLALEHVSRLGLNCRICEDASDVVLEADGVRRSERRCTCEAVYLDVSPMPVGIARGRDCPLHAQGEVAR